MTTGSGEEFLSARVDFEVPQEAMGQLRELNTELERTRVNSESAARGVESFSRYIDLMTAAQERTIQSSRNLAANLERIMQIQERAGSADAGTAVPQQYISPWAAGAEGTGRHRDVTSAPTTVPAVGGTPADFERLMDTDPRAFLNARAAWGGGAARQGMSYPSTSVPPVDLDRLARTADDRDRQIEHQESKGSAPAPGGDGGAGRGGGRPAPRQQAEKPPWESWRDRAAQFTGAAGTVASGFGMGGSFSGALGMAGRALQGWGARQGTRNDPSVGGGPGGTAPRIRPGGGGGSPPSAPTGGQTEESGAQNPAGGGGDGEEEGAGGLSLGSAAGWGGAALGTGLGLFGAFQKAGQQVQQYRNLGSIRGGGFGEGFGYEMQARMMALNPFITTEQSRQIMQSALTQGYTGKEFDTVTGFMAHNLKEMNMSAAESMKMLQEAAHNSNESVQGIAQNLQFSMGAMKGLSGQGYNTLPARQQAFESTFGTLMQQGASPAAAARQGLISGQEFSDEPGMQDMGQRLDRGAATSDNFGYMMMQFGGVGKVPGADMSDPDSLVSSLADSGQYDTAKWNTIKQIATWSHGNVRIFRMMMQRMMGVKLDVGEARKLMQDAMQVGTHSDKDPLKAAHDVDARTSKDERQRKIDAGRSALGGMGGGMGGMGIRGGLGGIPDRVAERYAEQHGMSGHSPGADIEQRAMQAFGGHSIEVGSGSTWSPMDITDPDQLKALQSGKMRIRQRGDQGPGTKLSDLPAGSGTGTGAGRGGGGKGESLQGQLHINVHPANMRSALNVPDYIPLTANEQAANSGFGNATRNNPPPGDGITSRGARGGG